MYCPIHICVFRANENVDVEFYLIHLCFRHMLTSAIKHFI